MTSLRSQFCGSSRFAWNADFHHLTGDLNATQTIKAERRLKDLTKGTCPKSNECFEENFLGT